VEEALKAWELGYLDLHAKVKIRIDGKIVETTLGRALLNGVLPPDLRDYNAVFDSRRVRRLIGECYLRHGWEKTAEVLDQLKEIGFRFATLSGLTISIPDCEIPPEKWEIVQEAQEKVDRIQRMYLRGLCTAEQRYQAVTRVWRETVDRVEKATMQNLARNPFNPVYGIVASGARGSSGQVKQLAGMRGPMADPQGRVIEWPVISNFREGLSIFEYFISTHGARKGTADTALRTATAGYLTRRLVDACVDVIVKEYDCGTKQGVEIDPLYFAPKGEIMEDIPERIYGRVTAEPVYHPVTGEVLIPAGVMIDRATAERVGRLEVELDLTAPGVEERAHLAKSTRDVLHPQTFAVLVRENEALTPELVRELRAAGIEKIRVRPRFLVRSPVTCQTPGGVCQLCYGMDLAFHRLVEQGTAVGIIAAQSIGEPGTQLTMRTFHTGGVAGVDITQGLPRAEELFEARKTTKAPHAAVAPIPGRVLKVETTRTGHDLVEIESDPRTAVVPSALLQVGEGEEVDASRLFSLKSPVSGQAFFFSENGQRYLAILDEDLDRVYLLPEGVRPVVGHRQEVEEGQKLTEEFHVEAVVAEAAGRVEVVEDKKRRHLLLHGRDGRTYSYEVPYGAQILVQNGEDVEEGRKLTTRSRPMSLTAEVAGTVLLADRSLAVVAKGSRGVVLPVPPGLEPRVEHGAPVREGQEILRLGLPPLSETVVVEEIQRDGELCTVRFRFRARVECTEAAIVREGDKVERGDPISKGVVPPQYLMEVAGVRKAYEYLLEELQRVYKTQGVDINDKHFEVVLRQILNNVRILDPGESNFLLNDIVPLEIFQLEVRRLSEENERIRRAREEIVGAKLLAPLVRGGTLLAEAGETLTRELLERAVALGVRQVRVEVHGEPRTVRIAEYRLPQGERELLRISRVALVRKSWLAAASFERTTKVLADAALRGEEDHLDSLKPCLMVGKKIPVGTGFRRPEEVEKGSAKN